MPLYEYRCRTCDEIFDARRPMVAANDPAECSAGHVDSVRLLSVFAATGSGTRESPPARRPAPAGGCGGHCACH